jgi:hypothetical protein
MKIHLKKSSFVSTLARIAVVLITLFHVNPVKADFAANGSQPHGVQVALGALDRFRIYDGRASDGFTIGGGFFSGRASGINLGGATYSDNYSPFHTMELEDDQPLYAAMIDARYDFNHNGGTTMPLHPYVLGGLGMAMYGSGAPSVATLAMESGDMTTLFRVGGGLLYHVADQLDVSVDYKAGFSGIVGEETFASHTMPSMGTHALNMGMHYVY